MKIPYGGEEMLEAFSARPFEELTAMEREMVAILLRWKRHLEEQAIASGVADGTVTRLKLPNSDTPKDDK